MNKEEGKLTQTEIEELYNAYKSRNSNHNEYSETTLKQAIDALYSSLKSVLIDKKYQTLEIEQIIKKSDALEGILDSLDQTTVIMNIEDRLESFNINIDESNGIKINYALSNAKYDDAVRIVAGYLNK